VIGAAHVILLVVVTRVGTTFFSSSLESLDFELSDEEDEEDEEDEKEES